MLAILPRFFDNPARTAYVAVIVLLQIFSILYNPQVGRNQEKRKSEVTEHNLDLVLVQVFSLAVVLLAPLSDERSILTLSFSDTSRFIGLAFLVPGFILMQMAEKYLAKQFSVQVTVRENHKLIQNGPYTYVRHPRYLGILTFFTGISLTFRSLLAVLLVVGLAVVLVWRVFAEEALMQKEFGKEWEEYRSRSWRILPFVF